MTSSDMFDMLFYVSVNIYGFVRKLPPAHGCNKFGDFTHTHGNKLGNTFSSSEKFQVEEIQFYNFLFSGDTEILISYLPLATGQFI